MHNANIALAIALGFVLVMVAMIVNKDYSPYKPCDGLQGYEATQCREQIDLANSGAGW